MYETGASPVWIPLRAPGQYHDPETDWDYNGARYYAPDMGQFTAMEPMEVVDAWPLPSGAGNVVGNPYQYAFDNPAGWADPNGGYPLKLASPDGSDWYFVGGHGTIFAHYHGLDWTPDPPDGPWANAGAWLFSNAAIGIATFGIGDAVEGGEAAYAGACGAVSAVRYGVQATDEGLGLVVQNLTELGADSEPYNAAMVSRLEAAIDAGAPLTGADAQFYLHEIAELGLRQGGMEYQEAHAAALATYALDEGMNYAQLYAPEVVAEFSEWFDAGTKAFWGIK